MQAVVSSFPGGTKNLRFEPKASVQEVLALAGIKTVDTGKYLYSVNGNPVTDFNGVVPNNAHLIVNLCVEGG